MNQSLLNFSTNISHEVYASFDINIFKESLSSIVESNGYKWGSLAIPDQIHSSNVKYINKPGKYINVDGLVTRSNKILLTIKVADCVPVFIYDPIEHIIGLIHSGWRGIVKGIIQNTLELMHSKGSQMQNIKLFLGPSIGKCCYEVDSKVAKEFDEKSKIKIGFDKWKIDLHEEIRSQVIKYNISRRNIQSSKICTFDSIDYQSYRRDGNISGRMFAFLGINL